MNILEQFENKLMGIVNEAMPEFVKATQEELQRTERWQLERLGRFTGSKFGELMKLSQSPKPSAKDPLDWGQSKWLFNFGKTALTYIKITAAQRVSGVYRSIEGLPQFEHGHKYEPEAIAYLESFLEIKISPQPFIKFDFMPYAGASPDGSFVMDGHLVGVEVKSHDLSKHIDCFTEPVVYGHDHFWQCTGEMEALNCNKLVYASYNPDMPENCKMAHFWVSKSKLHSEALKFRITVAECLVRELIKVEFRRSLDDILNELKSDCGDNEPFDWAELKRIELAADKRNYFEVIEDKIKNLEA